MAKLWKLIKHVFRANKSGNGNGKAKIDKQCVKTEATSENSRRAQETQKAKDCVADLVEHLNAKKDVTHFYHESGEVVFEEAPMTTKGFIDEWNRLFEAFPNIHLSCTDIEVVRPDCITAMFQAEGTHTGGPYSFGPFPEIPVTGIHVKLAPE